MHLADMAMEIYAMDSALCRAEKTETHTEIADTFVNDALSRVASSATQALASLVEGDTLRSHLSRVNPLLSNLPINTVQTRRRIAEHLLDVPLP